MTLMLLPQPFFFRRQYTYASVFQMLRGSIIVFSGILSVLFLKRCALITFTDTPKARRTAHLAKCLGGR